MSDDHAMVAKRMQNWHTRVKYLQEHYTDFSAVRMRPTGDPLETVMTSSGPLTFETRARLSELPCLVPEAPRDPAVGNAIDELLGLRFSKRFTIDTAASGRYWAAKRYVMPESGDEVWDAFVHLLQINLTTLRSEVIDDDSELEDLARLGMVLGLHAAVHGNAELCHDPERRHSRLMTSSLDELLDMADPPEVKAVAEMLRLATQNLPAPSQLKRVRSQVSCGHGSADLLLDGTLIEVKARMGTRANTALTAPYILQLLGYALSVPRSLDTKKSGPVTRAGWYLARYGVLWDFPIEELPTMLAGRPITLERAREAFAQGVRP
jgi:hypothetical protein